jgi:hypothetical protein
LRIVLPGVNIICLATAWEAAIQTCPCRQQHACSAAPTVPRAVRPSVRVGGSERVAIAIPSSAPLRFVATLYTHSTFAPPGPRNVGRRRRRRAAQRPPETGDRHLVPIQRASRRDPLHRQRQDPRASVPPISVPAYNPARHLTRARMMWRGVRAQMCARCWGTTRCTRPPPRRPSRSTTRPASCPSSSPTAVAT